MVTSDLWAGRGRKPHGEPEVERHRVRVGGAEEVHRQDHKTLSGCYQGYDESGKYDDNDDDDNSRPWSHWRTARPGLRQRALTSTHWTGSVVTGELLSFKCWCWWHHDDRPPDQHGERDSKSGGSSHCEDYLWTAGCDQQAPCQGDHDGHDDGHDCVVRMTQNWRKNIDQVDDDIESVDQKAETALADFEDMDRWELHRLEPDRFQRKHLDFHGRRMLGFEQKMKENKDTIMGEVANIRE